MDKLYNLNAIDIQEYQQNRYPLLFVDMITEACPGQYANGFKNFTYNEWFFPAHFKDEPNVPGFIQIESLTQVFLMTFLTIPEYKGKKTGFVSVKNARFKKPILPGERLDIEAVLEAFSRGFAKGRAIGYVNEHEVCSIQLEIAVPEVMKRYIPKRGK
ncbi:3-hydroxyacyl-[acyl-carrier-protein] dehydratase [Selenomonas sp. WCT3]|uniref:3-hydroxyacyl-ACP dehydratase FabZ family protein n=1 Tax=Selenomonas sp. WCT3 TaxID=3158785 RepID=UPI00088621B9|nr:3-hydroxyacyl-[acyl-carrier-protein] dehydratase [Selenomonas ruminantium]